MAAGPPGHPGGGGRAQMQAGLGRACPPPPPPPGGQHRLAVGGSLSTPTQNGSTAPTEDAVPPACQRRPHSPEPGHGHRVAALRPAALPTMTHTLLQSCVPDPETALPDRPGATPGRPLRPRGGHTAHPARGKLWPSLPPRRSCPPHTRPHPAHLPPPSVGRGSWPGKGREGGRLLQDPGQTVGQGTLPLLPTLGPRSRTAISKQL